MIRRYGVRYQWHDDHLCATLYVTRWGRVARWLRLPNRYIAKFTETPLD